MTDVTLTMNGVTFTFNEGDVLEVSSAIGTAIENTTVKGGPMSGYNWDNDGAAKVITVSGALTVAATTRIAGYTVTSIADQKKWLESLANGSQNGITFTSDYESQSASTDAGATLPYQALFVNTSCHVSGLRFSQPSGKPNSLPFSLTLQVGTSAL